MKNKFLLLLSALTVIFCLTGCGEDPKLTKFKNDIEAFCQEVAEIDADMNNIDATEESAKDELLDCLDRLEQSFKVLAQISIPEEFSYMTELTTEAGTYMTTAVEAYHEAYSGNSFNEYTAEYAYENYERACKRVNVILKLLHGENVEDEDVSIEQTNENQ